MLIDRDKTGKKIKKLERQTGIAAIFSDNNFKEMDVNTIYDTYVQEFKEKIVEGAIYSALKDMHDKGYLTRERRTIKRYINGHPKDVSVIFYKPTRQLQELHNESRKLIDEISDEIDGVKPELDLVPEDQKSRPAFNTPSVLSEKEAEIQKMQDKIDKVQEVCKPVEKEKETKKKIEDMLNTMSTGEALVKLYQGYRIVSAVSGNVYVIMDKKGITCSLHPGEIITTFPANEMEGMWRLLEDPKPCPYCGSSVKLIQPADKVTSYYLCENVSCRAKGPLGTTPEEALRKHNTRA